MGISGFRSWFETQFPDSVVPINADASRDTFDHVLLDMNHVIHIIMRRSRGEDHVIRMLMSELDRILKMAVPTKSLVIALDGAPPAAKLATQRTRRYGTLVRTQWKLEHFDKLRITKRQRARKLRNYDAELNSLQITPGTELQASMEQTLLYWAWQRLQNRHSQLANVRIYISPSTVAGEGEVKLLEWILQKPRHGESVAMLGGDSDLLLEGLIIPPYWTHNLFVIQADSSRKYFSVSLWETTRKLQSWLPANAPAEQILQLRTDLVLLMIMNGNDYMPKLRGSKGFSKLCQIYQRLVRQEYSSGDNRGDGKIVGFVDPDSLSFRLDFCIKFFGELAPMSPISANSSWLVDVNRRDRTPLAELNNIMEGGFIPGPRKFILFKGQELQALKDEIIDSEDQGGEGEDLENEEEDVEDDSGNEDVLVKMTLGDPDSDDYVEYEYWTEYGGSMQDAKQKLALMALDDFFGTDLSSSSDGDFDKLMAESGISTKGYSWELPSPAPGDCRSYLGGLLWNIQTYQDGICADYNFSYGKRMSPGLNELLQYFMQARSDGRSLDRQYLLPNEFSPPVSAGLSCLAALPSEVKRFVPEPYRSIPDEVVEQFYSESMDRDTNVFDMKLFETLCEKEIDTAGYIQNTKRGQSKVGEQGHLRHIYTDHNCWTVFSREVDPLVHPFNPPESPNDKFSDLIPNPRVRVSRSFPIQEPRLRTVWGESPKGRTHHSSEGSDLRHLSFGKLLRKGKRNLFDIPYKVDYPNERRQKPTRKAADKAASLSPEQEDTVETVDRMRQFNISVPPKVPVTNPEGKTAMTILSEMHDLQMIGPVEFNMIAPSPSEYASSNPEKYEKFQLTINPHRNSQVNILNRTINLDQDRDVFSQGKVALKQHLADLALRDIIGPPEHWYNLTFADIRWNFQQHVRTPNQEISFEPMKGKLDSPKKKIIVKSTSKVKKTTKRKGEVALTNKAGQTAMECLTHLVDCKLIGAVKFGTQELPSKAPHEKMILTIKPVPVKGDGSSLVEKPFKVTETRTDLTRKVTRQRLASKALTKLSGAEVDWSEISFDEFRSFLTKKASKPADDQPHQKVV